MTVKDSAGTAKTKTQVLALMTETTPDTAKTYTFDGSGAGDGNLYQHSTLPGHSTVGGDKQLAFVSGQTVTLQEINQMFPALVVDSVSDDSVAAAGGTTVHFFGDNMTGITAIAYEGPTAFTSVTVISLNEVSAVTPAKTAGTYDVIFTDDSGSLTKTDFMTTA